MPFFEERYKEHAFAGFFGISLKEASWTILFLNDDDYCWSIDFRWDVSMKSYVQEYKINSVSDITPRHAADRIRKVVSIYDPELINITDKRRTSMITLSEILSHEMDGDHRSRPLAKLALISLWSRRSKPTTVKELAFLCSCGERTVYRAIPYLKENGYIYEDYNSCGERIFHVRPDKITKTTEILT